MSRYASLFLACAFCVGCGKDNPPGVITLPPRPRGEIQAPDSVQTLTAVFDDKGKEVLLAGGVEWDAKRAKYPREKRDHAWFVSLADVASGKEIWKATQRAQCGKPVFVPGQPWVLVWVPQGFEIWDRKTGAPIRGTHSLFAAWPDQGRFVRAAEGRRLVGWGYNAQAPSDAARVLDFRVWELPTFRERMRFGQELVRGHNLERVLPAPQGPLALLVAPPNEQTLFADPMQFHIWDTESGKVLHTFGARHENWNRGPAAWSPDGRHLLLDRFEVQRGDIRRSYPVLWDAVEGKLVRSFADRPRIRGDVSPTALLLAFSGDGAQAVSVDWDSSFRRWEVATGKELTSAKFDKVGPPIHILALSKDGALAVSNRREVLDTATGKVLQTLEEAPWERPPWGPVANQPDRPVKGQ
jgi:hypothetical protein